MIRTNYTNPTRSAAATPVRPVQISPSTLPVGPVPPTDQTGPNRALS